MKPLFGAPALLSPDYTQIYHNPNSKLYVEGPGLVRLDNGTLIAVVPVIPRGETSGLSRVKDCTTHILASSDGGKEWRTLSTLPYYSSVPWTWGGALYLFTMKGGAKARNDDLLLLRSNDGGKTWSQPVTLFTGHFWNCHTAMVVRDNKLYWAVDDLSLGANRGPVAVIGDLSRDPLDKAAWRLSNPVAFPGIPEQLANPKFASLSSQYLEPNVIEVQGQLRVLATVKPKRQSTVGICAVLDLNDDGRNAKLTFNQYSAMPGGQLKFCVLWDEKSQLYWATANLATDSQGLYDWWEAGAKTKKFRGEGRIGGNDRRFLMLLYSLDALNWFQAGCIAQAGKISQSFMYARPVIDGDHLAIIARSSINAPSQHDADYATFHRVPRFRDLALNLKPQPEK
ncbi:MAG: sialidase family protein [Verrucomicrobiota bacterium]